MKACGQNQEFMWVFLPNRLTGDWRVVIGVFADVLVHWVFGRANGELLEDVVTRHGAGKRQTGGDGADGDLHPCVSRTDSLVRNEAQR